MKRVFICSPYRGKTEEELKRNIEYAKSLAFHIAGLGFAPYVPHLYLPLFLDDNSESARQSGIEIGTNFMSVCDRDRGGDEIRDFGGDED